MTIITPTRADVFVTEDLRPSLRFASFLLEITETLNAIVARSVNTQDANYTFLLTDALTIVRKTSSTANQVYTIPSNSSVAFEIGHVLEVQNDGSVAMKVAIITDTLTFEADGTTGTRSIAAAGSGRFVKVTATSWKCRGQQMT